MSQVNPYAAPRAQVADMSSASAEMENLRRQHLGHEASIKSIGLLYFLGGVLTLVSGIVVLVTVSDERTDGIYAPWVFAMVLVIFSAATVLVGSGMRALRGWAHKTGIGLAVLGLLAFPVGTLINAYVLWLLLSKKGRFVFSPGYPELVRVTPHIRYRTSIVAWVLIVFLMLFVGWVMFFADAFF
ncbi:MAG: hypothetical protein ACKVP2_15405 [Burkholderiales bacterium]